ncbi:hypothetical protein ACH3VR_18265 [Microbacterium sp. B2969]|uniref:Uncharacterized protein n=1 Tax=Microbacterium alkaliflavum TaxID=3248839 RepID=A0ABW7QCC4_9MICO
MRSVPMFDHAEKVTTSTGEEGRVIHPTSGPPVEFFDPLEGVFIERVVNVAFPSGEVRRFLASSLTTVDG